MKLSATEVTQTLGFLDAIYGNLMPQGDPQIVRDAWIFALEPLGVESGELLPAARLWALDAASAYPPRPGQLGQIIARERHRRQRQAIRDAWERRGGLVEQRGILVNPDGEIVDTNGKIIPEIGEGRPKDGDIKDIISRVTTGISADRRS